LIYIIGVAFRSSKRNKDILGLDFHGDTCFGVERSLEARYDMDLDI
jgi:hypothetical protein